MKLVRVHQPPSTPLYFSLISVFTVLLITLSNTLMGWVWVLCGCAISIAIMRIQRKLPNVKNITLNLLAIFCMILLIYLSSDFGLMSTMVNLLVVAGCLKLINMQSRSDYHVILIIQLFLVACGLIYHQSLYMVALYFSCIVLLFASAFLLNRGKLSLPDSYKQSFKMLAQALPITLALFVVVPRLPPFWQTVVDPSAQTGLSERLTPGDIANLAKSDELVFRAEFTGTIPSAQQRYWRSIVLDYFDGRTWSISRQTTDFDNRQSSQLNGDSFQYLVMAEPNSTRWLYALDIPVVEDNMGASSIYMNRQYQLYKNDVNAAPALYIVRSYYEAPLKEFVPQIDFAKYLQLPVSSNPRTDNWVNDNIQEDMSFVEKLSRLNRIFTDNQFSYTLQPVLMPNQVIDRFLFDNQAGFCSHYASALTYMLRVANIPARMVAGYQGGDQESDSILSVRQYDAHAWVEAYDPKLGWVRFDPTALVAPDRTILGLMSALNAQETALLSGEIGSLFDASVFDGLRKTLAIVDFNWNTFVLGFNQDSQVSLIEEIFGELNSKNLTTFLFIALAATAIFLGMIFLPYKKWLTIKRKSQLQKILLKLAKNGYIRKQHESLLTFYTRIQPQLHEPLDDALKAYIDCYYASHYQNESHQQSAEELKRTGTALLHLHIQAPKKRS